MSHFKECEVCGDTFICEGKFCKVCESCKEKKRLAVKRTIER